MRKLLTFLLLIPAWCFAQTGQYPDFWRTPKWNNVTVADGQLKAWYFNLPHYSHITRRHGQDSLGTMFLSTVDQHIYIKKQAGSVYSSIPFLSEVVPINFTAPVTVTTNGFAFNINGNLHLITSNAQCFVDILNNISNTNQLQISSGGQSVFRASLSGVDSITVGNIFTNKLNLHGGIIESGLNYAPSSNIASSMWLNGIVTPKANGDTTVQLRVDYKGYTGQPVTSFDNASLVGGSGYTNGTYTNIPLAPTILSGEYNPPLLVNLTVSGGAVTSVTLVNGGVSHTIGEVYSVFSSRIGGTGSGFNITCLTIGAYTGLTQRAVRVRGGSTELAPSTASYPSLIIPLGSSFTGTQSGAIYNNGTHLYVQLAGTPWQLDQQLGVNSVFGRNGNVVAQNGDYNTSQVTESGNLYFTNARAIGATLTGYSAGAGTITSADNIVQAIGKLQGNITASVTGVSSFNTRTGTVTLTTADVNSAAGTLSGWSVPYTLLSGTIPTWNQNTTGTSASSATLTTPRNINGVSFNGSANITITANTPNSLLNGYGVLGGSFNGSASVTLKVDTSAGKLQTKWKVDSTINAHGASAGIGINGTLFASGTVAVDTAGVVVSKGYLAYYVPVKRGSVALVSGTKAITIAGLTTSSMAIVSCKSQGGTTTTTQTYTGACSTNTLTINAVTNAGTNTVNTGDTSTISYTVYQ